MPRTKPKSPMRLTMKAFRFAKIALGRVYQKPMSRYDTSPTASQPKKDRKSTRLNSSHSQISYAVFCLKKKKLFKSPARFPSPPAVFCISHQVSLEGGRLSRTPLRLVCRLGTERALLLHDQSTPSHSLH